MKLATVRVTLVLTCAQPLLCGIAEAAFVTGDVFPGTGDGRVFRYSPTGTLLQVLNASPGEISGMAFETAGNLYATNFQGGGVDKFDDNGVKVGSFGSEFNSDPESILFDKEGNVYVGQADGTRNLLKFNSSGTLLQSYAPVTGPRGTDWIDLAADRRPCSIPPRGALSAALM